MRIELIVTRDCEPCEEARAIWSSVCATLGYDLDVVARESLDEDASRTLNVLPAVRIDGRLVAIGVQTRDQAATLIANARQPESPTRPEPV